MKKNNKCPKCGSSEISQGKQFAQGKMFPIDNITMIGGSNVIADICTNCGYIFETRVEKPEKFRN